MGTPLNRRRKYKNAPTEVDGQRFDSKKEATHYLTLKALQKAGQIRNLERQIGFQLRVNGVLVCTYRADFVYEEKKCGHWSAVVEDVKGYVTEVYKLKKKLMWACHKIAIREV